MNNTIAYKFSQLPAKAFYIGIDPRKRQHIISVQTADIFKISKIKISNDQTGFERKKKRCGKLIAQYKANRSSLGSSLRDTFGET